MTSTAGCSALTIRDSLTAFRDPPNGKFDKEARLEGAEERRLRVGSSRRRTDPREALQSAGGTMEEGIRVRVGRRCHGHERKLSKDHWKGALCRSAHPPQIEEGTGFLVLGLT